MSKYKGAAGKLAYRKYLAENPGVREIDYADRNSAQDMRRALLRDQWTDYKERFFPREEQLADFAMSDAPVTETMARVGQSFDNGAKIAEQSQLRDLQGLGLSETARQKASREKRNVIENSAAKLSGLNQSRLHVQDTQNQVLSGSAAVGLKEQMTGASA